MPFSPKPLKRLFRRGSDSPTDTVGTAVNGGGSKPPPERHKTTKMKRAKRTATAVASHVFDVVRETSDAVGPLKSVVNGVGLVTNVWQNVRRNEKDARMLHLEVDAFRTQLNGLIPDVRVSVAPMQIVDSLIRLDEDLHGVEAITGLLSADRFGSRILHWKERDGQLKNAETRFRRAKERFSIGCSVAAAIPYYGQQVGQLRENMEGSGEKERTKGEVPLESVLKVSTLLGLFGSYGSMAGPALSR